MIFGKRQRTLRRILIVEDEPLVAFDNEHVLGDAGFVVAAAVDTVAAAVTALGGEDVDLVLADVRLSDGGTGLDVAQAAQARGVPVLFVTGACPPEARALAVGCLSKPYSQRDLISAIEAVEAIRDGKPPKRVPRSLKLFGAAAT